MHAALLAARARNEAARILHALVARLDEDDPAERPVIEALEAEADRLVTAGAATLALAATEAK